MSKSCGTHGLCTDTQPNRDLAAAATGPGRSRVRRQPCHSSSCSRQHAAAATAPTPLRSNSTRSWPHQQQYGHGRQPSTAQAPQPPAAPLPSILRREQRNGGRGEVPRSSPEADPWGRRVRLGLPRALARPYGRAALTRVRFICGRSAPAAHLRRHAAHRGMTAGRRRLRICCCCCCAPPVRASPRPSVGGTRRIGSARDTPTPQPPRAAAAAASATSRARACAAMAAAPSGMRPPAHVTPHNAVPSRRTRGARRLQPDARRTAAAAPAAVGWWGGGGGGGGGDGGGGSVGGQRWG